MAPRSTIGYLGPDGRVHRSTGIGPWVFCIETVHLINETVDLTDTTPPRHDWLPNGHFAADPPPPSLHGPTGPGRGHSHPARQLPHPMLDLLLPGSWAAAFLLELLATVGPADVAGPIPDLPVSPRPAADPVPRDARCRSLC